MSEKKPPVVETVHVARDEVASRSSRFPVLGVDRMPSTVEEDDKRLRASGRTGLLRYPADAEEEAFFRAITGMPPDVSFVVLVLVERDHATGSEATTIATPGLSRAVVDQILARVRKEGHRDALALGARLLEELREQARQRGGTVGRLEPGTLDAWFALKRRDG